MNKLLRKLIFECAALAVALIAIVSGRTPTGFLLHPRLLPWITKSTIGRYTGPAIVGSQGLVQTVHAQTCGS